MDRRVADGRFRFSFRPTISIALLASRAAVHYLPSPGYRMGSF